jgi:hypothetical protein
MSTGAVDILNAGWEVFINGSQKFRRELPEGSTTATVHAKLNEVMMKALELVEAKHIWTEVSGDPKH